jgi:transposase
MDTKNWGTVAGYTGTVWKVGEHSNKVLSVAKSGNLEPNLKASASDRRSTRKPGLASTLCGWHSCTRPPTRSWWKKGGEEDEKLGRSRGGFSTKIHIRCEGKGKPITFILSPGQRNESIFLEQLMEQGAVKRSGRGRPRLRPLRLVGDKGYTGRRIRNYLRRRGIRLTIPRLSNEPRRGPFSREIYRQRNVVERAINRIKQFRRIATRYEKLAVNYTAMITIASILLWL